MNILHTAIATVVLGIGYVFGGYLALLAAFCFIAAGIFQAGKVFS